MSTKSNPPHETDPLIIYFTAGFLLILFLEAIVHKFFGDHEHFDQRAVSPPTASSSEV
jgi:hypothetical protein